MIDMYGSEVGVGDTVITFVKKGGGKGCILKHVVVAKVNPNTIEFEYEYVPTVKYYKPSVKTAKRNLISLNLTTLTIKQLLKRCTLNMPKLLLKA